MSSAPDSQVGSIQGTYWPIDCPLKVSVDLHVQPVSDIAVSLYLPTPTKGETTTFFQGTSFVSSPGNFAGSVSLPGATSLRNGPLFRASAS